MPGKSKKGELSLFPTKIILLSPCLRMLPKNSGNKAGLTSQDIRCVLLFYKLLFGLLAY